VEAQTSHQHITIGGHDGNTLESDLLGFKNLAAALQHWEERVSEMGFDWGCESLRLAFPSSEALAINDLLKLPVRISDIVSMSSETRAV
jgi:hypothetical protein